MKLPYTDVKFCREVKSQTVHLNSGEVLTLVNLTAVKFQTPETSVLHQLKAD